MNNCNVKNKNTLDLKNEPKNQEYGCKILKILLKFDKSKSNFNNNTNNITASFIENNNYVLSISHDIHLILNPRSSIENNSQEVIGIIDKNNVIISNIFKSLKNREFIEGLFNGAGLTDSVGYVTDTLNSPVDIANFLGMTNASDHSVYFFNVKIKLHRIINVNNESYILNEPYLSVEQLDKNSDGIFRPNKDIKVIINSKNFDNTTTAVMDGKSFSADEGQYNVVKNIALKMPEIMAYTIQACGFTRFIENSKQCEVVEKIQDFSGSYLGPIFLGEVGSIFLGEVIKNGTDNLHIKIYIKKDDLDNYLYLSIKAKNSEEAKKNWNIMTWFTKIEQGIFGAKSNGAQSSEVYFDSIEYVNKQSSIFNFKIQCSQNTLSTYVQGTNFLYLTNIVSYEEDNFFAPLNTMIITPNYLQLQKNRSINDIQKLDYSLNAQTNVVNGKIFVGINGIKDIVIDRQRKIITIIARNDNVFECQYKYDNKIENENERHLYDTITDMWFIANSDKDRKRQKIEMNGLDAKIILPMSEAKMREDFAYAQRANGHYTSHAGINCMGGQYDDWYGLQDVKAFVTFYEHGKKIANYASRNFIRSTNQTAPGLCGDDDYGSTTYLTIAPGSSYPILIDFYSAASCNKKYYRTIVQYTCDEWKWKCKNEGDKCTEENLVATWAFFERHPFGRYLNDFILIEGKNNGDVTNPDVVFEFSATDLTNTSEKSIVLPQYYTSTSVAVDKDVFYKMTLPKDNPSGFIITTIDGTKEEPKFTAYFSSLELNKNRILFSTIILIIQIGLTVASIISKVVQSAIKSKRDLTASEKKIFKWLDFALDAAYAITAFYDVKTLYSSFSSATKQLTGLSIIATKDFGKLLKGLGGFLKSSISAGVAHIKLPSKIKEIMSSEISSLTNENIENITDYFIHHPKIQATIQDIIDRWKKGLVDNISKVVKDNGEEPSEDFIKNIVNTIITRAFELSSNPKMLEYRLQIKSKDKEDGDYVILKYLQNIQQFGAGYIYDSSNKNLTMDEAVFLNYILIENALFYYVSPFQNLYANNNTKAEIIDVEYTKCPF